jgi:hypothetical protein
MKIAQIVGSNSHIDYVARIGRGREDVSAAEYGFGHFVRMDTDTDTFVGVIYDSRLINPEFSGFAPRLQPQPSIDEPSKPQKPGVLVGIILLGTIDEHGADHSVPQRVVPVNNDVITMSDDDIRRFHLALDGTVRLEYYSRLIGHSGQFAVPLLESIMDKIERGCSDEDKQRLGVIRGMLKWQSTFTAR